MDDLILRHAYSSSNKRIDAFYNKCDDAFDRFVAAVEDRFGVRANMIDSSEASIKYPFFALIKDWRNTGYDISGYISYDDDNDTLEIVYYAATTDHTDWCESRKGEDIIAWLDDKMVKKESHRPRGRMLKEDVDETITINFTAYDREYEPVDATVNVTRKAEGPSTCNLQYIPILISNALIYLLKPLEKDGYYFDIDVEDPKSFDIVNSFGPMLDEIKEAIQELIR